MPNRIRPLSLIILLTLSNTKAVRNYDIILKDVACSAGGDYLTDASCVINKTKLSSPRVYTYCRTLKEIHDLRLEFSIHLDRHDGNLLQVLKIRNLDACTLLSNKTTPILKMMAGTMTKFGTWPQKCPIPKGFEFKVLGAVLDPEYLPSFIPEADVLVKGFLSEKTFKIWEGKLSAKIVHKRNKKVG